jgi:hypothetical protein
MTGNVWEFVLDIPYGGNNQARLARSGSYSGFQTVGTAQGSVATNYEDNTMGFRLYKTF